MKFWQDNKTAQPFNVGLNELADDFFKSEYATEQMPLERSVRLHLAHIGTWEPGDENYDQLLELITLRRDHDQPQGEEEECPEWCTMMLPHWHDEAQLLPN